MTAKKTTKKTATTKNAKAAKNAAPADHTPAPDIIDAGGGILVEIAPPPAKASKKPCKAKPAKNAKAETGAKPTKLSALDAAAKVLASVDGSMNTKELVEMMAARGLWTSPGGKTPHATLYAAILREITTKGKEARFAKTTKGHFAATKNA